MNRSRKNRTAEQELEEKIKEFSRHVNNLIFVNQETKRYLTKRFYKILYHMFAEYYKK